MTERVLGTVVYSRTDRLRRLLESAQALDTVYVADNGDTEIRADLYRRDYPFDLRVLDVEYDAGVARSRNRIVEAVDAEAVLVLDADMEVPPNADVLFDLLAADESLGGVAGALVEPENRRVYQSAKDLQERGTAIVRTAGTEKEIQTSAGYPLVYFDVIPQAGVFRTECLREGAWDPEYTTHKEHLDFFVNHWRNTDWRFAVTPSVNVPHYPGGSRSYTEKRHERSNKARQTEYFLEKWGYDHERMDGQYFYSTEPDPRGTTARAIEIAREDGLVALFRKAAAEL